MQTLGLAPSFLFIKYMTETDGHKFSEQRSDPRDNLFGTLVDPENFPRHRSLQGTSDDSCMFVCDNVTV